MMKCKRARKLISGSVDGLLSPAEKALLDDHLSECSRCSEDYANLLSLDSLLSKALPLQATLGDGFAARVAERLPAKRTRLSIIREAFVMSRMKYAVLALVLLAVGLGYLFAPRSKSNEVLAAVQSAMAGVESWHYSYSYGPGYFKLPSWRTRECWSTRDAFRMVDRSGWSIIKEGAQYQYLSRYKILLILPAPVDVGEHFGMMTDPREILRIKNDPAIHVTVREVTRDGRPMQQIEVDDTRKESRESFERRRRVAERLRGIIAAHQSGPQQGKAKRPAVPTDRDLRAKQVYLVDPSTSMIRSVDFYYNPRGSWRHMDGRIAKIDYNVDIPDDLFEIKTPPGTKVYDLRDEASPK